MPTYEYICYNENCGHEFETFQSMKEDALRDCPECGEPTLKRKIGLGAGIIFKGSGFYETDYKRKSNNTEEPKKSETKAPKESKPADKKSSEKSGTSA